MSFKIKNNRNGTIVADGITFNKGQERTIEYAGKEVIARVAAGDLISTPPLTGLTADADLINNMAKITNTTGTAASVSNGAVTIAAISTVGDAANAIATLAAQMDVMRSTILNQQNEIERLRKKPDFR